MLNCLVTQVYPHVLFILVKYKIRVLVHTIDNGRSPKCISETFKFNTSNNSHETRNKGHLNFQEVILSYISLILK